MKKPSSKTSIKSTKNTKKDPDSCVIYSDIEMKTFSKDGKLLKTKIIKAKNIKNKTIKERK